jgi:hypothetical protein
MTLVSVIVPVYNVESYLSTCVESLLAQTHEDLEVVLVNDGSTDGSGALCDAFAARDSRVRAIHKRNGGLSDARNAGLLSVRGDYTIFVDGDDWVEHETVASMLESAQDNDADVAIAGVVVDHVDAAGELSARDVRLPTFWLNEGDRSEKPGADDIGLIGYAWNKIYRTAHLRSWGLRFDPDVSLVEDVLFNRDVLCATARTTWVDGAYVHYLQRPRPSLGTQAGDDLIELRMRAASAVTDILAHWGFADSATAHVGVVQARITVQGLVLQAASSPHGTGPSAQLLRAKLDSEAGRRLLQVAGSSAYGWPSSHASMFCLRRGWTRPVLAAYQVRRRLISLRQSWSVS